MSEPEKSGAIRDETGRFIAGVSGNPAGRPLGTVSVVAAIKKKLEEHPEGDKRTYLQCLVDTLMKKAVSDEDVAMIKDIIDRIDGKPSQNVDVTSGGETLKAPVVYLPNIQEEKPDEGLATTPGPTGEVSSE